MLLERPSSFLRSGGLLFWLGSGDKSVKGLRVRRYCSQFAEIQRRKNLGQNAS